MAIEYIVLCIFLLATLLIGYLSGKRIHTLTDFMLSRNSFSKFAMIASLTATCIGGSTLIGTIEEVYYKGFNQIYVIGGLGLQMIIIGCVFGKRFDYFSNYLSFGQIIQKYYGRTIQALAGIIWVIFSVGVLIAQIVTLNKLFTILVPNYPTVSLIISFSILVLYSYTGGIRAIIATDKLQFIIILAILPVLIIAISKLSSPITPIQNALSFQDWKLHNLMLNFLLGSFMTPIMFQRMLICKNSHERKIVPITSGIILLIFCIALGTLAILLHSINPNAEPTNFIGFIFNTVLQSPILKGLGIISILAATMSTADSLLNSASATLVNDVIDNIRKNKLSDAKRLKMTRISVVIIGITAISYGIHFNSIWGALLNAYKFWAPTLVVPLCALLLGKKISHTGLYTSFTAGLVSMLLWDFFEASSMLNVSSLLAGFIASSIVFSLFYIFQPDSMDRTYD